jgi:Cys-tRNA(Pro) deacylase
VEADTCVISSASTHLSCGQEAAKAKFLPESGQDIDSQGRIFGTGPDAILVGMLPPALRAADQAGLRYRVIRHGPVGSLADAARARGVEPADVVKTLVVRRSSTEDFLFVLIPGDRAISWPKLRALLKVGRLSLPDPAVARNATGYERGTITPFGSREPWPVIADERIAGREITLGAGEPGVAMAAAADDIIDVLGARLADISQPETSAEMRT